MDKRVINALRTRLFEESNYFRFWKILNRYFSHTIRILSKT